MRWTRRRSPQPASATEAVTPSGPQPAGAAEQLERLDQRLQALEQRLEGVVEALEERPSHADLLDLRVHTARVSAEVARVAMELRGEIVRAMGARDEHAHEHEHEAEPLPSAGLLPSA